MAGITADLSSPLFSGSGTSPDVPYLLPVALGGRPYLIDLTQYRRSTVPALRQPQDTGEEVGENSLNTEGLWTRAQSDFSLGSGQEFFDDDDSLRRRFYRSIGIDPWTRNQATLLPGVESKRVSTSTNFKLLSVGSRLYLIDGNLVLFTTNPTAASPTWTTVTGTPAATALDFDTDGYDVYVAYGASDLYRIAGGGSTASALGASDTEVVGYTNGRLLAANDNVVSEVSSTGTYTALFTHPLTGWQVRGFTSSPSHAYFFGDTGAGGKSSVYRISVQDDGTLSAAIYAGEVPLGETINEMAYYSGVILMATTGGVRVANVAGDGSLVVGPLIEIDGGSQCVTASGRYAWFGWDEPYGEAMSGLGRADLGATEFPEGNPPYATDIQALTQTATPMAVASHGGRRYFAISGVGVFGGTAAKVESGWLDSGRIRHGTLERKVGIAASFGHDPLAGTVAIAVRDDMTGFTSAGSNDVLQSVKPGSEYPITARSGEWLGVKVTLTRSSVDITTGPILRRWTLRVLPSPKRIDEIVVPIILRSKIRTQQGAGAFRNLNLIAEYEYLRAMETNGRILVYQEGSRTENVYIDRVQMSASSETALDWSDDHTMIEGTLLVRLLTT